MVTVAVMAHHRIVALALRALAQSCGYRTNGGDHATSVDVYLVALMGPNVPPPDPVGPSLAVVEDDVTTQLAVLRAGFRGYLGPSANRTEFKEAVAAVSRGELWAPRHVVARALDPAVRIWVTPREQQVLALLGQGLSNKDIARKLGIKEKTVKAHVSKLLAKYEVDNRVGLALRANGPLPGAGFASSRKTASGARLARRH